SLADEDRRSCRAERTAQREQVHGLWHHGASPILLEGGHETLAQSTGSRRRDRPAGVGDVPAGRGCSRRHGDVGSSHHAGISLARPGGNRRHHHPVHGPVRAARRAGEADAGWLVPKKYVEKVGDDGFKKAPIGAGPYRFVSFTPGIELVLEAYEGYWRKMPSIKRLVLRSLGEETTRAAALKKGEVDIAYLFS